MWPVGKLRHREVESCVRGCTAARWLGCATNPGWLTTKPAFKVKSLNQQQQGKFVRNAHYYLCNILMPTEVRPLKGLVLQLCLQTGSSCVLQSSERRKIPEAGGVCVSVILFLGPALRQRLQGKDECIQGASIT